MGTRQPGLQLEDCTAFFAYPHSAPGGGAYLVNDSFHQAIEPSQAMGFGGAAQQDGGVRVAGRSVSGMPGPQAASPSASPFGSQVGSI